MAVVFTVLVIVGTLPLLRAWWTHRRTSLAHALVWAIIAWLSWAPAMLDVTDVQDPPTSRYLALCLTGCAGVAVLGARRPHVFAWNFVVIGLLCVMLLPLAERHFIGTRVSEGLRVIFMSVTIAVATLNYVPTRFGLAALLVLTACEIVLLFEVTEIGGRDLDGLLAISPGVGWLCWRGRPRDLSEFDRTWLEFRDAWGFVWSQRVREQFNASAQNAGWPVHLDWHGLSRGDPATGEDQQKYLAMLHAVLQRFVTVDQTW